MPSECSLPSHRVSIACFGECMVELNGSAFGTIRQSWGGDTYNTAVYLRRLLPHQCDVHYMTALGEDPLSQAMKSGWQREGLRVDYVMTVSNKRPGMYQITLDGSGERSFVYWRNDSAAKYVFDLCKSSGLAKKLSSFNWFYLSGISLAILTKRGRQVLLDALEQYVQNGGRVVFDNNYRPGLWESRMDSQAFYHDVMSLTTIALLTEDDEYAHFELSSCEDIMNEWQCPELVIKRGAKPCHIRLNGEVTTVAPAKVNGVLDTTAAGDSFAAGYLATRLLNGTVEEAAAMGHRLAGRVIQYKGAVIAPDLMDDITMSDRLAL